MKRLVLKYLPIPIAIALALICFFTLSDFIANKYEYAIISYASRAASADISVSNNGVVVKIIPVDSESNDAISKLELEGMHISDALVQLSSLAEENETVYVGAYIHEDAEVEPSEMKPLLEEAISKLEVSCLGSYGVYDAYDMKRANSYNRTIRKMAFMSKYADTVTETLNFYMDSYLIYEGDPFEIAFYANYVASVVEKNAEELFDAILTHVTAKSNHISYEEAKALSIEFLQQTLNWTPEALADEGYRFDEGDLGYAFGFRFNGENRVTFVDVVDGSVREYFVDDY